jgi:outer membrane protein OmpA-like peptidoglycan-associated protein
MALVCAFAISLVACARPAQNLFVLLPNPDGTAGQITVSNQGGSQTVSQPGYAAEVKDAQTAPGAPSPLPESEIARLFGAALAVQPEPPARYLLYFKAGSTQLTEDSARLLPEILRVIEARRSNDVSVVGHSDRVGTRESNYRLSLDRATEIRTLLVFRGVDPRIIQVDSHGEDNPLIPTDDEVSEPRNRRVEVTVR